MLLAAPGAVTAGSASRRGDAGVRDLPGQRVRHLLNNFLPIPAGIHFLAVRLSNDVRRRQEGGGQDGGSTMGGGSVPIWHQYGTDMARVGCNVLLGGYDGFGTLCGWFPNPNCPLGGEGS